MMTMKLGIEYLSYSRVDLSLFKSSPASGCWRFRRNEEVEPLLPLFVSLHKADCSTPGNKALPIKSRFCLSSTPLCKESFILGGHVHPADAH